MCKTKNVIIEIIQREYDDHSYVVRELPKEPNQAPVTLGVFISTEALTRFLDELEF